MRFKGFTIILGLLLLSSYSFAERVNKTTTIDRLYTYPVGGEEGDIIVKIPSPPTGCEAGYWLESADTRGYKNTVSFILSAFHTQKTIILSGSDAPENRWSGSQGNYCKILYVTLIK